jgi:hypothetical protein
MSRAELRPSSTALNDRQFDPNVFGIFLEGQCEESFYKKASSVPKRGRGQVSCG